MISKKKQARDDFTIDIKRRAADRVNSLCSICFQLTKAASAEGNDKVSNLGVAAHICAAAPGPGARRYDPNMTSEERSSIENCIWLCQDHAKLIDTDEVKYTISYLKDKKRIAEEKVAKAIIEKEAKIQIIKSTGFSIEKIIGILQEKVVAGDFFELNQLLKSMDTSDSDDLEDLHDYFEIIYSFYCENTILDIKIENYKKRIKKNYINQICELFIQHFETKCLSKIIELCTNKDIKKIANHIINGTFEGEVITLGTEKLVKENFQRVKLISKGDILHKLASNFVMQKGICMIKNGDGSFMELYDEEFVYKQKKIILELFSKATKNLNLIEQKLDIFSEYKIILENLDKIKIMSAKHQSFFFLRLLIIASNLKDEQAFERLYAECCSEVRENSKIKEIVFYERIIRDVINVDFAEVRKFCEMNENYELVNFYLNEMMVKNYTITEEIIKDHQFLFNVHSMFLETYIRLKMEIKKNKNFSAINFLNKYKEKYKNESAFHIYMAFYSSSKKNKIIFEKEVKWLEKNVACTKLLEYEINNLSMLIAVYNRAGRYQKLLELDALMLPNFFRLLIASYLQNSKRVENIKYAKKIYSDVVEQKTIVDGLYRNLSKCCYAICEIQEAKEFIIKEIKLSEKKEDYLYLLQLRYETNDTIIDEYIEKAKELQDHRIDHMIGVFFLENNLKTEAKQFLLRSLLIDDKNIYCMNSYLNAVLGGDKAHPPKKAGVDVTAQIVNNSGETAIIAIHKNISFPKGNPNKFAKCRHYKESDRAIEDLTMAKVGDEIKYKGTIYKVCILNWNEITFREYIMTELIKHKRITAIYSKTTEEVIEKLTEMLLEQNKYNANVIKMYNEFYQSCPTSLLVKLIGKSYLQTYDFLFYENTKKLRNLNSLCVLPENPRFILSFETIYTLAILGIDEKILNTMNCLIPISVKRIMTKEIDEFIAQNKNERTVGQAMLINGKIALDIPNDERRKTNIKFLNRIKRILEEIPIAKKQYSYIHENELKKTFAEHKFFVESDTLGCAGAEVKNVLIVDDPFLSSVTILDKINAIGLNKFLTILGLDIIKHLECIKTLAQMNFDNYFTLEVYEYIKQRILKEEDYEMKEKLKNELRKIFTAEFIDATLQPDLWKHNNLIIHDLGLQKRLHVANEVDEFDAILLRAVIYNFSKEYPEEFKKKQEGIVRRFRSQIEQIDDKIYIKTWLEPEENS